jgi:hypothetical protein
VRLEWSRDGGALLTCVAGTLRRHEGDASTVVDGPTLLDARWRDDGAIVSVDELNQLRRYKGGTASELPRPSKRVLSDARIAASDHYLAIIPYSSYVATFEGREIWRARGELVTDGRAEVALSDDARYLAFAGETRAGADFNWRRMEGRGWVVVDTKKHAVTDRGWLETKRDAGTVQIAIDGTGKRLAVALPGQGASIGTIRIAKGETYPQDHLGGARAVALDSRGLIAAFAYPKAITAAPRRLRVDYLERGVKGDARIAITETLWIDPDLDDIVALTFDRASRQIACLGASGTVEIVPVP